MSLFSSSRWLVGISAMLALPAAMANERVQVVTSFSILADMVENVGGEHVTVSSLVGPDGDAHVFSPSPGDARALAGADLVVFNGLLFEGWMERLIDSSDYSGPMVTATDGLSPRAQNLRDHQMCRRAARVSCREISKTFRASSTLFARESRAGYLDRDSPLSARAARGSDPALGGVSPRRAVD